MDAGQELNARRSQPEAAINVDQRGSACRAFRKGDSLDSCWRYHTSAELAPCVLASACFFGALAAILSARIKSKRARVIVWILCASMFFLIGFSRIYLGVHHTTDVIAGFAAALIWILVVRFVEMELARRKRRKLDGI